MVKKARKLLVPGLTVLLSGLIALVITLAVSDRVVIQGVTNLDSLSLEDDEDVILIANQLGPQSIVQFLYDGVTVWELDETGAITATGEQVINGGLAVSDGITVTAGGVDFPANAVALADVNLPGANVSTVCASGCDYTTPRAALVAVTGAAESPEVVLVLPGIYTDTQDAPVGAYEYVVGFGIGETEWRVRGDWDAQSVRLTAPSGLRNMTISGGYTGDNDASVEVFTGSGTVYLRNLYVTAVTTESVGLYVSAGSAIVEIEDCKIVGGNLGNSLSALFTQNGTAVFIRDSIISSTVHNAIKMSNDDVLEIRDSKVESTSHYGIEIADTGAMVDVYNVVFEVGGAESIHVSGAMTATICLSPMTVALDGTLTNDCTNPHNPTLP